MKLAPIMAGTLAFACASTALAQSDPLGGGSPAAAGDTIIVGSADFPESQLIATIYAEALEAKGIATAAKMNIGSREVYIPALNDGSIALIPEYSGSLLRYLAKDSTEKSSDEVLAALGRVLPEGVSVLNQSGAQDTTTLAVTRATAERHGLVAMSDLKSVAGDMVLGGPPEWKTRADGVPGLERVYGLNFQSYKTLDVCGPLSQSALVNGQIDAACIFTTDPAIVSQDLVALTDPSSLYPAQNVVPLIASAMATSEVTAVLDAVSAALTTEDLLKMNQRVADHEGYEDIAADFLTEKGLN